jgi:hypothetical protein
MFSGTAQVFHQVCQFFCQFYWVPWDSIVVSAGKLRKLWDCLSELRSSLCERRLERTVLRPELLHVRIALLLSEFDYRIVYSCRLFVWFGYVNYSGFGGLGVSMLASGTQDRAFAAGKIHSKPSFGGEVKQSVPCPSFGACKRTQLSS